MDMNLRNGCLWWFHNPWPSMNQAEISLHAQWGAEPLSCGATVDTPLLSLLHHCCFPARSLDVASVHWYKPQLITLISWESGACAEAAGPATGREVFLLSRAMVAAVEEEEALARLGTKRWGQWEGDGWASFWWSKMEHGAGKGLAVHFASAKHDPQTGSLTKSQISAIRQFFWFVIQFMSISPEQHFQNVYSWD